MASGAQPMVRNKRNRRNRCNRRNTLERDPDIALKGNRASERHEWSCIPMHTHAPACMLVRRACTARGV
eukprot:221784-Chlamydomonas_euryale.AAC.1